MILAGEIGGTHARLAAFETEGNKLNRVIDTVFESQQHSGLAEIISEFVKKNGVPVDSACFGVAGPVRGGRCKISNLSWIIDSRELANSSGFTPLDSSTIWRRMPMGLMRLGTRISSRSMRGQRMRRGTELWFPREPGLAWRGSTGTDAAIILSPAKAGTRISHRGTTKKMNFCAT